MEGKIKKRQRFLKSHRINFTMDADMYSELMQLVELESAHGDIEVTLSDLVRNAIEFCYGQNERLRASFARMRDITNRRWQTKIRNNTRCVKRPKKMGRPTKAMMEARKKALEEKKEL